MIIFELPLLRLLLLSPFLFPFIRPGDDENDDDDDDDDGGGGDDDGDGDDDGGGGGDDDDDDDGIFCWYEKEDVENKNFSKCCKTKPSWDEQVFNWQKR